MRNVLVAAGSRAAPGTGRVVLSWLAESVFGWVPDSFAVADDEATVTTALLVVVLLIELVGDGIVGPVVEELYYRGHLLARLPVRTALVPCAGAGLFTLAHLWEPALWPVVFVAQVVNCLVLLRLRNVWIAAAFHALANSIVTMLGFFG